MIQYTTKDITTVGMGVIAHGVNCQGAMNSGVAKAIRNKWPKVYEAYKRNPKGRTMLGSCHIVNVSDNDTLFIANCYTQNFYGYGGKFADPKAIKESVSFAMRWADYYDLNFYMPQIGAGRGGLDWETEVRPIVEELAENVERIEVFVCLWEE